MDKTTTPKPDLPSGVYSISLADLRFNLEKKNTSRSKRAVGTEEIRRVIAEMEQRTPSPPPQLTEIHTQIDTSISLMSRNLVVWK